MAKSIEIINVVGDFFTIFVLELVLLLILVFVYRSKYEP